MRFVIYGAGAIGGVIGARLHEHGPEVVLIARGEHRRAIERDGLRLETPEGSATFRVPVAGHPSELDLHTGDDLVVLAMKSQDTAEALRELAECATPEISVACAQNGVENERAALRLFANVYGVVVMLPAAHLEPGVVQASSAPTTGILDVGRYPRGTDGAARPIETDYLNGEIVLLGRLHGVPTPVNEALQRLANRMAAEGRAPGSLAMEELPV